jgi:hypothetical protein
MDACLKAPRTRVESRPPDEILFDPDNSAATVENFAVAHMAFQTLINTYPNSPRQKGRGKLGRIRRSGIAKVSGGFLRARHWGTQPFTERFYQK